MWSEAPEPDVKEQLPLAKQIRELFRLVKEFGILEHNSDFETKCRVVALPPFKPKSPLKKAWCYDLQPLPTTITLPLEKRSASIGQGIPATGQFAGLAELAALFEPSSQPSKRPSIHEVSFDKMIGCLLIVLMQGQRELLVIQLYDPYRRVTFDYDGNPVLTDEKKTDKNEPAISFDQLQDLINRLITRKSEHRRYSSQYIEDNEFKQPQHKDPELPQKPFIPNRASAINDIVYIYNRVLKGTL